MADTKLVGVKKQNRDLNKINKIDTQLLTWFIYHGDRTDIWY